ncbi:MAG: hypothetical protein K0S55_2106 [Clostridia bacterium]|nr:hypothetical protein [Clostridia bacterium]
MKFLDLNLNNYKVELYILKKIQQINFQLQLEKRKEK